MRCGNPAGRRGFAIFISIGVLALLSVLASSFAIMSQMERSVANSYVDKVRAKLLATSGIEMAVSELGKQAKAQAWETRYQRWGYEQEDNGPAVHDDHRYNDLVPSARPSFVPATIPAGLPVCSGWLSSTYSGGADYYKLKVVDTASQIDLNGSQANLATILQNLGLAIAEIRGTNPVPAGMGTAIVTYRGGLNGAQFRSKDELLGVPGMTQALYDVLKDYVSVAGYRDPRVINPNPSANFPGNWPNAGQLVSRAPINLNTAPYPVLVAWAAGLSGYAVKTSPTGPARPVWAAAPVQFVKTLVPAITYAEAQAIAHAIIERRQPTPQGAGRPFHSMDDVAMFIDCPLPVDPRNPYPNGLVQVPVISADKGRVLMAMADPNLTTNKLFPAAPAYNPVDKQDLTYVTFEVCFSSMGVYEIEALGRVLGPDSDLDIGGVNDRDVRAEVRVRTVARVYRVIRETTQGDLTNISGFSTATLNRVNSYPENIQDFPNQCPFEGMLALSTEWTPTPVGNVIGWMRGRSQLQWDGGGAGMTAVPNSADPKDEGSSVFGGSDLHPDGLMTIRQAPEMVSYTTPATLTEREGAVDLWVRLTTPPTVGSDEPLLFLNVTGSRSGGNGNNAQATGECVKLERFGTVLRCTRFYWGYPTPALSPYWHQYVERDALIDTWQVGEWHHVALQWKEYDRPASDEWQEYDYWGEGRAYFWDGMSGGDEQTLYGAPDVNLRMFIDGSPNGVRLFTRYSQSRTYIVDNPPEATTLQRRVRLASKTPPPGWSGNQQTYPQGTIDVGGYEFDRGGAAPVMIYHQGPLGGNYVQRYSNCVIDDLTVRSNEYFPKTQFTPYDRFSVAGGAFVQHAIDLRGMAPNAVVGTVRWNQRLPWKWGDKDLWPTLGTNQAPYVACAWDVGNVVPPPPSTGSTSMTACEGVTFDANGDGVGDGKPRGTADRVTFRLDFINPPLGIIPLNVTPVVEDVSCTVIESPAFLSWESQ